MQSCTFLLQFHFHNLFGVVPGPAGIGHKDGLVEAEDGDGNQVADEEVWLQEGKSERGEEHSQKDVKHSFLRVLGADLHYLLAVLDGGLLHAFQADILLDELHCPVSAGGDGLHGCAGKPVDDGATCNQTQHEGCVEQREVLYTFGKAVGEAHNDGEDHG